MLARRAWTDFQGMPHRKPFAWLLALGICCALAGLYQAVHAPIAVGAAPVSRPSAVLPPGDASSGAALTVVTQAPPAATVSATAIPERVTDGEASLSATPSADSPQPALPAPGAALAPTGALPSSLTPVASPAAVAQSPSKAVALLDLMNAARLEEGLGLLQRDSVLEDVALVRAQDLIENGYFDHYSPGGESAFSELAARGIHYRLAGENLARNNFPESKTVDAAFEALMASPGHRDNILEERYSRAGVVTVLHENIWLYVIVFTN